MYKKFKTIYCLMDVGLRLKVLMTKMITLRVIEMEVWEPGNNFEEFIKNYESPKNYIPSML